MLYLAIVLGYCAALFLLVRLFDVVHQYDEDSKRLMDAMEHELKKKAA